ncbi:MAG: hypothetical protein ACJ74Q_15565 [Pyrinomonadaceae bacterium]
MAEEQETLIALPTVRRPPTPEGESRLVAVAIFTRERAAEILRLMEHVTVQASRVDSWVGVFKTCGFDKNTFYVPAEYVSREPRGNDFVVLDPDTTFPGMVQLVRTQINILPGAVTWEAHDHDDRFTVETPDLSADVLRAVAIGGVLIPGETKNAMSFVLPAEPLFDESPGLEIYFM